MALAAASSRPYPVPMKTVWQRISHTWPSFCVRPAGRPVMSFSGTNTHVRVCLHDSTQLRRISKWSKLGPKPPADTSFHATALYRRLKKGWCSAGACGGGPSFWLAGRAAVLSAGLLSSSLGPALALFTQLSSSSSARDDTAGRKTVTAQESVFNEETEPQVCVCEREKTLCVGNYTETSQQQRTAVKWICWSVTSYRKLSNLFLDWSHITCKSHPR